MLNPHLLVSGPTKWLTGIKGQSDVVMDREIEFWVITTNRIWLSAFYFESSKYWNSHSRDQERCCVFLADHTIEYLS